VSVRVEDLAHVMSRVAVPDGALATLAEWARMRPSCVGDPIVKEADPTVVDMFHLAPPDLLGRREAPLN
jgi:hypothetical protein